MKYAIQVYHGLAGTLKVKLKTPFLVYEDKNDAKIFANNYTDFSKQPKVIQFDLETLKLLDLTTEIGINSFEELLKINHLELNDIIDIKKDSYCEENLQYDNLDILSYKKFNKILMEKYDTIKGYSILENKKVTSYAVMNVDTLTKKQVLEINLDGNLWNVEFK